ncbi:helix-turn-helix domain-containing protein [Nocardia stercoris]|uniref:XRE family transcriptional regulator n=1 Tax=Nocardia stercoris TaxID=2483361 RepID=A0A3M2L617_9NOCA|nr:helix-turn-helix transcriptional regulator [Nocardia stercoris]RMI32160.1 XRE family transcriptional regulator [Nocardia stercoris]
MADYLKIRRGAIGPADVGLPAGPGLRRTPGLRREELAALAGVSVDYYTRIEQGRETAPSAAVLDALARALRLGDDEYEHLLALADRAAGRAPRRRAARREPPPAGLMLLLEAVRPGPAFVLNQVNDVLAANPEGLALFCGLADWPPLRRNMIRYAFCHPAAREVFPEWDRVARNSVAHLHAVEPADPVGVAALADELCAAAPEFAAMWRQHEIWVKRGGETAFRHPVIGAITLANEVVTHADGHRVLLYQAPPGSAAHDALTLLAMTVGPAVAAPPPGQ